MGRHKKIVKDVNEENVLVNINHIKEIIAVLTEIDKKMNLLNENSTKDFLSFYQFLIKYDAEITTISDNSKKMGELLLHSKSNQLNSEIIEFQKNIIIKSDLYDKRYKNHIATLEELIKSIGNLYIPLKDYKQNISDLKFLITNHKINANFADKSEDSIDAIIATTETLSSKINSMFPLIDESLLSLKAKSQKLIKIIFDINQAVQADFSEIHYKLSQSNMEIIGMVDIKTSQVPGLKERLDLCFKSINKIINLLQYQDIIKQKIDYIQNVQKGIVSELKGVEEKGEYYNDLSEYRLASRIPYIVELQAAQMVYTNQEYQNAIELTTNNFFDIETNLNAYIETCNQFLKKYQRIDKGIFEDITTNINIFNKSYEKYVSFKRNYAKDLKAIDKLSDEIYESFTTLNYINAKIEQSAFQILKKQLKSKENKNDFSFAKQLEMLSSNINKTLHNIQNIFAIIQKNSKYLTLSIENTRSDLLITNKNNEFNEFIVQIFEKISKEYPITVDLIKHNIQLSNNITKEIKTSIKNVEFYAFFNNAVEEILTNLNNIHKQLAFESIDIDQFKRDLTPKYMDNIYTTHTEKVLQNFTLNKLKGINKINNYLFSKSKREKDVEFF